MRIGTKKRGILADIALSLLVLAGTVSLTWAGLSGSKDVPAMASVRLSADEVPEDAFVVVVDAGHGGFDGGALGTDTGAVEAEINLAVAKLLADELTGMGFYVIMTRSTDDALGSTKDEDMRIRKEIFNLDCVDLVVSVHMNKFGDRSVSGPMVFYMNGSAEGKRLAENVVYSLCEAVERPQRFANPEDLFVLRVPRAPSVLVECGFLSNPEDEKKLLTEDYRQKLAKGIAEGIANYAAYVRNGDSE